MKILMTGSHGFVGSNLVEALKDEHELLRWNVREDKPLPDVDAVIHLAGIAHDTKHAKEESVYFEVNTELTKKLYDRFLQSNAKMFIFFSSIKAKDNDTPYAKSKKLAEDYISCHTEGTDFTDNSMICPPIKHVYILRPCMIHGKGNKGNLNLLVRWVKKGWPWPLAAFENKRCFASMGNVSFIVNELLNKDVPSGSFVICDDEPISTNELVELICNCIGKKANFLRVPQIVMYGFAQIGDLLHLTFNSERLSKLTENYIVDNSKIKSILKVENLPVDTKEGLRLSIKSII